MSTRIKAVVFDIDGTLLDSVDLHARAWVEAFAHFGIETKEAEVRRRIGKGGDQLLPVFVDAERLARSKPTARICSSGPTFRRPSRSPR
jgi:phosphoglycolate phosphatase-like HAD superfamily hydrolase